MWTVGAGEQARLGTLFSPSPHVEGGVRKA